MPAFSFLFQSETDPSICALLISTSLSEVTRAEINA